MNGTFSQAYRISLTPRVQWRIDIEPCETHILDRMKIVFADKRLALIRTNQAHELGLPFAVIKGAREKLHFLEEAPDERTISNWRSLQYKKREGHRDQRQIRINVQYRIIFTIDNDTVPATITILAIGDPH